ncbi:MAG: hypothetical protein EOM91_16300 [Sphingobacteriia bacterium]|nr:hypothetical protein [Sphingobacteriia bacterium]NCC41194.1 hypothetical protein [Gammaproteobacteria bacterium]
MASVDFSVPDAIKQAFNEIFKDQNKSAIIAELMREAVERAQHRQRRMDAVDRILERRGKQTRGDRPAAVHPHPDRALRL